MDRDILLGIPLSIVCKCNTNGQNSGGVGGGRGRGMHVSAALVREEAILIRRFPNFYNVVPPSNFVLIKYSYNSLEELCFPNFKLRYKLLGKY